MNFKIVISSKNKKNFVWYRFDDCSKSLKVINLISLIEVFDYSTSLISSFWQSFQLVDSFFIKNSTAERDIWSFDQDPDLILNERLILVIHSHFPVGMINWFHSLSIEFWFSFKLQHDKNSQLAVCIATCRQSCHSRISFDILQDSEWHSFPAVIWEEHLIEYMWMKKVQHLI